MSTKLEAKTNELCEAILEQMQTAGIRKRIDTFMADDRARSQYEALMTKGQALQEKQHHGQTLDAAEIAEFEGDRDALLKNPVATSFLDAQEEMHEIEKSVKKTVAKTVVKKAAAKSVAAKKRPALGSAASRARTSARKAPARSKAGVAAHRRTKVRAKARPAAVKRSGAARTKRR